MHSDFRFDAVAQREPHAARTIEWQLQATAVQRVIPFSYF
jgi:hypothetical protein